jgi:hypothetical protein
LSTSPTKSSVSKTNPKSIISVFIDRTRKAAHPTIDSFDSIHANFLQQLGKKNEEMLREILEMPMDEADCTSAETLLALRDKVEQSGALVEALQKCVDHHAEDFGIYCKFLDSRSTELGNSILSHYVVKVLILNVFNDFRQRSGQIS